MPHIIVEYTPDIGVDIPKLMTALHADFAAQDTVDINALKTRAIKLDGAIIGDNGTGEMLHIMAIMLPGRSDALRHKMADDLHAIARKYVPDENASVTCETIELHAESYIK